MNQWRNCPRYKDIVSIALGTHLSRLESPEQKINERRVISVWLYAATFDASRALHLH